MMSLSLLLDLSGTFVFALSGGLLAVRKDLDVVGVVVLSVATGLGGGIIRDLLLGRTPPAALERESYLVTAVAAAIVVFFAYARIERLTRPLQRFDALGLGLFAVSGTLTSLDAGLGVVPAVLLGVVTGVGGGALRDLLVADIPLVFRRDIYALAALLGAVSFAALDASGIPEWLAALIGVGATFALRSLSAARDWHAPRPRW
jgi:uncharacterized membrane protein YeiH